MQVRTGRTAIAAHLCNFLSPYHYLADFHQALGSVRVPTDELITVVNINHITIFGMVVGIHDHPARRRLDWRSRGSREINALMKCATPGKWIDPHAKSGGVPLRLYRHH